jgi:acetyltransferase-like isoleucine patch superfamily enzyme
MNRRFFQHSTALVESANIGAGTRIWAFAHVLKSARIGRDCNIGDHVYVEGGARIGHNATVKNGVAVWDGVTIKNNVFIGPNAVFTNDLNPRSPRFAPVVKRYLTKAWLSRTMVEEGASIGANATILCGVQLGKFCLIAAGTVVTRDVPPYGLVMGVPGELVGYVCRCGQRLHFEKQRSRCAECGGKFILRRGKVVSDV